MTYGRHRHRHLASWELGLRLLVVVQWVVRSFWSIDDGKHSGCVHSFWFIDNGKRSGCVHSFWFHYHVVDQVDRDVAALKISSIDY
jgi:hypothetical protein